MQAPIQLGQYKTGCNSHVVVLKRSSVRKLTVGLREQGR